MSKVYCFIIWFWVLVIVIKGFSSVLRDFPLEIGYSEHTACTLSCPRRQLFLYSPLRTSYLTCTFGFHKGHGVYSVAEWAVVCEEGFCSVLLSPHFYRYFRYHMKAFHNVTTAHYEVASRRFHSTLLRSPALMLFSKADPIGTEESNKKVHENWEKLGLQVGFCAKCTVCCWCQGLCDLLFTGYRGSTLEEKQTVKFTAVCHLLQWCRICGSLPSHLHIPTWPCLLNFVCVARRTWSAGTSLHT